MSLINHIENLRAKPEHIRNRIAFWSSFGITGVIFLFWLAGSSFTENKVQSSLASASSKISPPAQSLIAGVGGFFTDIRDLVFKPKKIEYGTAEVTAGKR